MLRTLLLIALFSYAHACTDPAANNVNSADPCTYDSYCAHGLPLLTNLTEAPSYIVTNEGVPDTDITLQECQDIAAAGIQYPGGNLVTAFGTASSNQRPKGCWMQSSKVSYNNHADGESTCDAWSARKCVKRTSQCQPIEGCMDPEANNYNASASIEGSCTYDSYCAHGLPLTNLTEAPSDYKFYTTREGDYDPSITEEQCLALQGTEIEHHTEGVLTVGTTAVLSSTYTNYPRGCYWDHMNNIKWNPDDGATHGGSCDISSNALWGCVKITPSQCQPIEGCPDPNALNEDVTASINDGSCQYDCFCKSGSGVGELACTRPDDFELTKTEYDPYMTEEECKALEGRELPCSPYYDAYPTSCTGTFTDDTVSVQPANNWATNPQGCYVSGKSIIYNPGDGNGDLNANQYYIRAIGGVDGCKCAVGERYDGAVCTACTGQTYTDTPRLLADGDQACTPHSYCPEGQLTVTAGTSTTDTVCGSTCSDLKAAASSACDATNGRVCVQRVVYN